MGHSHIPARRKRLIPNLAAVPEIWLENTIAAFFENTICDSSAHRKLKEGVLETHAKCSIHHRAVKSAVRSLKAKVAYCISLTGD
jgi:hypothetical protein